MDDMTTASRLDYRPDIEGLRAVAIALVVAAHAKVPWLQGGFIGVDVFFVLSGFLITGLLMREIQATGQLKLADFYARRIRRLLPALLLMLASAGLFGMLLVSPIDQIEQANAAGAAALWLSNIHFAFVHMDYFSPGSETNLFLHTWSLGVEEQFYLVWPTLLACIMGAFSGATWHPSKRLLFVMVLLILCVSLAWCLVDTETEPHLAFYLLQSRAWQFSLGALVFLYVDGRRSADSAAVASTASKNLQNVGGWLGLLTIIASAYLLDNGTPYPGSWAMLPSLGAAAILLGGNSHSPAGVHKVLAAPPMQAVGRVSYSWYLWHWPVLLLASLVFTMGGGWMRFATVLLSFCIAWLAYRFVEAPIRRNRNLVARPYLLVCSAIVLMLVMGTLSAVWQATALQILQKPEQRRFQAARLDAPVMLSGMDCDDWYHSSDVRICKIGPAEAAHTLVVLGDSVGVQWFPAIARVFQKPEWRLFVITKSSCPIVDEPIFYERIGREYTECSVWRTEAVKQIAELHPDVAILGSSYTYKFSQEQWIEGTARILRKLNGHVGTTYMIRSTPVLPFDGPTCLAPRSWLYAMLTANARCEAVALDTQNIAVYGWLEQAATRFPHVSMIDMTEAICPSGRCQAELGGIIVFRDTQHLTASFAASMSEKFRKRLHLNASAHAEGSASSEADTLPQHE